MGIISLENRHPTVFQTPPWHPGYLTLLYHDARSLSKRRCQMHKTLHSFWLSLPFFSDFYPNLLSLLLFLMFLPAHTVLPPVLPGSPYHPRGEGCRRLNSACAGCCYIRILESSHLQSTTAKKTWQPNTYSLFRNDKEQLPWQFFFVILEPTLHYWIALF